MGGLWPTLARSVILINPAGSVVPQYPSVQLVEVKVIQLELFSLNENYL